MNCNLPGSSVHGISQARILEWVAISFSRESFLPGDWTLISCFGKGVLYHWDIREALAYRTRFYKSYYGFLVINVWIIIRVGNGTPLQYKNTGKSHGQRSLESSSPWGHWGSDMAERLHFHFSLSCIGEGNGNPLQCSCLEDPRDGGAWWAAIYGVAQSRTWLKWLSSSMNHYNCKCEFLFHIIFSCLCLVLVIHITSTVFCIV